MQSAADSQPNATSLNEPLVKNLGIDFFWPRLVIRLMLFANPTQILIVYGSNPVW